MPHCLSTMLGKCFKMLDQLATRCRLHDLIAKGKEGPKIPGLRERLFLGVGRK